MCDYFLCYTTFIHIMVYANLHHFFCINLSINLQILILTVHCLHYETIISLFIFIDSREQNLLVQQSYD